MLVGVQTRHANRILDRVRTTVSEEHLRHIRTGEFNDALGGFAALVVRMLRSDRRELRSLFLNRSDNLRVLMPDVDVHQLRGEVQELVAVVIPEVRTLGGSDTHRVECSLRTPRVEYVLPIKVIDVLALLRIRGKRHTYSSSLTVVFEA